MNRPDPLKAVYEFCQEDESIYWELVEELELSVQKLIDTLEEGVTDMEALRFIAHKMKSTFRILKDEHYKEQLDAYIEKVGAGDEQGIADTKSGLLDYCQSYLEMIRTELGNRP